MKNIKVYNYFLDNTDEKFNVRYLMIYLVRTYIYNFGNDKTIYYRKRMPNPRKISLLGKDKFIRIPKIFSNNINYSQYKMCNIDYLLHEYVTHNYNDIINYDISYDIAKRDFKSSILVDSTIHKEKNIEIVSMNFDNNIKNKDISNIFWINSNNKYEGLNSQISI